MLAVLHVNSKSFRDTNMNKLMNGSRIKCSSKSLGAFCLLGETDLLFGLKHQS